MDLYSMLKLLEVVSVIFGIYMVFFTIYMWQIKNKKEKVDKIKIYTFEYCVNDNKNYDLFLTQKENISKINDNNKMFLESNIYQILCSFEKIAIGVKNRILDEDIIHDYYFRYFFLFFKMIKYDVLIEYRNNEKDPFIFIEYEKLLNKWINKKNNEAFYVA